MGGDNVTIRGDPNALLRNPANFQSLSGFRPATDASGNLINPNAGGTYLETPWLRRLGRTASDNLRATLAYEKNAGRWGHHRMAALAQYQVEKTINFSEREVWLGAPFNADPANDNNSVWRRSYITLGDSASQRVPDPLNPASLSVTVPGRATPLTNGWIQQGGTKSRRAIDSQMFALQSAWWQRRIVTTLGYRRDELTQTRITPTRDTTGIWAGSTGVQGFYANSPKSEYTFSGSTTTAGIVLHPREWLSVFANHSKNLGLPDFAQRVGADGGVPPAPQGNGFDAGLMLSLRHDRIVARASYFTTDVTDQVGAMGVNNAFAPRYDQVLSILDDPNGDRSTADRLYTVAQMGKYSELRPTALANADSLDNANKGYEFRVTANVGDGLRFIVNYSYNLQTRANVYKRTTLLFDQLDQFVADLVRANPGVDVLNARGTQGTTLADLIAVNRSDLDGRRLDFEGAFGNRKHKANFFANYTFKDALFKGWSAGFGGRYLSPIVAGRVSTQPGPPSPRLGRQLRRRFQRRRQIRRSQPPLRRHAALPGPRPVLRPQHPRQFPNQRPQSPRRPRHRGPQAQDRRPHPRPLLTHRSARDHPLHHASLLIGLRRCPAPHSFFLPALWLRDAWSRPRFAKDGVAAESLRGEFPVPPLRTRRAEIVSLSALARFRAFAARDHLRASACVKPPRHPRRLALLLSFATALSAAEIPAARPPWTTSAVRGTPEPPSPYRVERAFPQLEFAKPLEVAVLPGTDRLVVVEQGGKLRSFRADESAAATDFFGDVSRFDRDLKEAFAITFHPRFSENRYCYIFARTLTPGATKREDGTRILRFKVTADPVPQLDHASGLVLITWLEGGHNGGNLRFGPDGMLYFCAGDAGPAEPPDPLVTGQDISDLLASVLRIDVDRPDPGRPYGIPRDNPFVGVPKARGEVWAFGLRNPWRLAFDPESGELYTGDVGWQLWEMIQRIQRGANYGWSLTEGGKQDVRPDRLVGPSPIKPPLVIHSHEEAASITGGEFYHGKKLPGLSAAYRPGRAGVGLLFRSRPDRRPTGRGLLAGRHSTCNCGAGQHHLLLRDHHPDFGHRLCLGRSDHPADPCHSRDHRADLWAWHLGRQPDVRLGGRTDLPPRLPLHDRLRDPGQHAYL